MESVLFRVVLADSLIMIPLLFWIVNSFFNIFDNLLNFFSFLQNPMLLSLLTNYLYYCFYIISIDLELFQSHSSKMMHILEDDFLNIPPTVLLSLYKI